MNRRRTNKRIDAPPADPTKSTGDTTDRDPEWQGPLSGLTARTGWQGPLEDAPAPARRRPHRRRDNKDIDLAPGDVITPRKMNNQLTEQFRQIAKQCFPNMSDRRREAYIAEGFRIDAEERHMRVFETKSRAQPDKPLPYSERPPGMTFEDFLRHEYRDKGLLTENFTLKTLRQIDIRLSRVYYKQLARADIPEDIRIPKSRRQLNRRERGARSP